jgi:hypothetical protein
LEGRGIIGVSSQGQNGFFHDNNQPQQG